jgi:hypothetical protein
VTAEALRAACCRCYGVLLLLRQGRGGDTRWRMAAAAAGRRARATLGARDPMYCSALSLLQSAHDRRSIGEISLTAGQQSRSGWRSRAEQ